VHVLEKDIKLHNHAYSTVLNKFTEVFELDKRAVQVVSAGFHSYCQTEYKRFRILQTDPKHLRDFAASFVKQPVFIDDICKAYERLANSPVHSGSCLGYNATTADFRAPSCLHEKDGYEGLCPTDRGGDAV
jgi:hypothetical protein